MSALTELLRGRGAHADPVAAVSDLTAAETGRGAPGFRHTIWQQVCHLNYWMEAELKAIEGPDARHSRAGETDWPGDGAPADDLAWRHELALFRLHLDQLRTLADAQASTLARIVHRPGDGGRDTVESVLWLLVAHNSYHIGQVVALRQALDLWPPTDPNASPPASGSAPSGQDPGNR